MEAPEIDKGYSNTSAVRDSGSVKLMEFCHQMLLMLASITPVVSMQLMEFYHQVLLMLASITSVILQAVFQSEGIAGFESTLLTGLADFSVVLFVMGLGLLLLLYTRYRCADLQAYARTVSVVLEDYALLCMINKKYIEIFIIPVTILLFIGALSRKVREYQGKYTTFKNGAKSPAELMKMAVVPYLLQLSFVVWTQYIGRLSDGIFIFSNFLLFFSSALCAVTVMIASLPIGESPGVLQVLPVMHKTCIIVLLMTAYSMAVEGLGEDIVFVCMPELTAVLGWFTICFHHPGNEMNIKSATSWSSGGIILSFVIAILSWLAPFSAKDGIILASWFIRVFCISFSSSALSFFHVWLLRQWPGITPNSNGLVHLLKFSSLISCITSAGILCLTVLSVDEQILQEATSSLQHNSIAAALVVFMLLLSAAWLILYFPRKAFPESDAREPRGEQEVIDDVPHQEVRVTEVPDDIPDVEATKVRDHVPEIYCNSEQEVEATEDPDHDPQTYNFSEPDVHDVPEFKMTGRHRSLRRQDPHIDIHGSARRKKSMTLLPLWSIVNVLNRKLNNQQEFFEHRQLSSIRMLVNRLSRNNNCEPLVLKLACDINDLLDFTIQRYHGNFGGLFGHYDDFAYTADDDAENDNSNHINMRNYTDKLEDLMVRLADITEDPPRTTAPKVNPKLSGHYGVSKDEEQAKYLQELLAAGSERPEVVCIFWTPRSSNKAMDLVAEMNGQIQDAKLFHCHVSVGADPVPNVATLINNMVTQADSGYTPDGRPDSLRRVLRDKRYLVVIDHLKSEKVWSIIKNCFPENNKRSRIIISTECEAIAKSCDHFYWLPVPAEIEVESLFSKEIYGSLSGIFASKPHTHDAFSSSGLQWKELEQMKELIRARYNKLPSNLRICLLYLSIFPKKHKIDIERLVRLWIANDFIYNIHGESEQGGQSMEQRARSYIEKLIAGKFINPSECSLDGTLRSCHVHQLVYEFIVYQATKEKFFSLIDAEQPSNHSRWHNSTKEDQAAAGHDGADLSHVVSVTVYGNDSGIPPLTKPKVLRVLDFDHCKGPVCLDGLCKLLLLRYLSLNGTDVSDLHSAQIVELKYLQTLDVRSTKVKEIPSSIIRLENLMHLLAGNAELPSCIGMMKGLLTLSCTIVGKSSAKAIEELSRIAKLEQLELFCDQMLEDQKQITFLSNGFSRLKKLCIDCSFPSVIFNIGALPMIEVLELKFKKGHPEKLAGVSGIEHLVSLTHVIVEFSHQDGGSRATLAEIQKNHPTVFSSVY